MGLLRKVGFAILLRSLACSGEELECGNVLNEGGHFNYPSTCWQSFASGVPINITWETTFAQINLFYTRVVNTGDAWPLACKLSDPSCRLRMLTEIR